MKERKDTMDGVGLLRGVRRASGTRVEKDQVRNGKYRKWNIRIKADIPDECSL